MVKNLTEEMDGQLSFLGDDNQNNEIVPQFITFTRKKIKSLYGEIELVNKYLEYPTNDNSIRLKRILKKDFYEFILKFCEWYKDKSLEEILEFQENYSTDYHKLCKLFLDFLNDFVFSESLSRDLEDPTIIQLENFIMMDQVSFRNSHYNKIKEQITTRKKIRVENYLIFRGDALINKIDYILKQDYNLFPEEELNSLVSDVYYANIFDKCDENFLETEPKSVLSALLLFYLEKRVYGKEDNFSSNFKKFINQMEVFIVFNYNNQITISNMGKNIYEKVKINVGNKICNYINKYASNIKNHLRDYDKLESFKKSGNYRLIEASDDLNNLPQIISEDELRIELENFLNVVFTFNRNVSKEDLPIFSKQAEKERHIAMEIALEYFGRFVYRSDRESEEFLYLEDFISEEKNFVVTSSFLCLTKSKLLDRVNRRNVKQAMKRSRNLLQTNVI